MRLFAGAEQASETARRRVAEAGVPDDRQRRGDLRRLPWPPSPADARRVRPGPATPSTALDTADADGLLRRRRRRRPGLNTEYDASALDTSRTQLRGAERGLRRGPGVSLSAGDPTPRPGRHAGAPALALRRRGGRPAPSAIWPACSPGRARSPGWAAPPGSPCWSTPPGGCTCSSPNWPGGGCRRAGSRPRTATRSVPRTPSVLTPLAAAWLRRCGKRPPARLPPQRPAAAALGGRRRTARRRGGYLLRPRPGRRRILAAGRRRARRRRPARPRSSRPARRRARVPDRRPPRLARPRRAASVTVRRPPAGALASSPTDRRRRAAPRLAGESPAGPDCPSRLDGPAGIRSQDSGLTGGVSDRRQVRQARACGECPRRAFGVHRYAQCAAYRP